MWDLTDLVGYDFAFVRPALGIRLNSPHVTCRVRLHEGRLALPLKAEYDRATSIPHGRVQRRLRVPLNGG